MTKRERSAEQMALVAIDVAKKVNEVLIEIPGRNTRQRFRVANQKSDYCDLATFLHGLNAPVRVAFEPTGMYHRPLAHFLGSEGFEIAMVSSLALARVREARHNSWDKNDPKDAQVILQLMKAGMTIRYYDPVVHGINDIQELSQTYHQLSLAKTRLQHSLLNHYLPLYFPEAERFYHSSRSRWLAEMLLEFPTPASITAFSLNEFIARAWPLARRRVNKTEMLTEFYRMAEESIAVPVSIDSHAIEMFRSVLRRYRDLCVARDALEDRIEAILGDHPDYRRYLTVPGIGPIVALTVLAEAGDVRRFSHHRQFLKFCGFDLATQQSGEHRGATRLSKRGNARLRTALWLAASVAIRLPENSFRAKFTRYVRRDPTDADLRRKAFTAVAAKIARVIHSLAKSDTVYRPFHEVAVPSGRTSLNGPSRHH
jgi:transposase